MWKADLPEISDGQVAGRSQGLSSSHGQCLLAEAEGEEDTEPGPDSSGRWRCDLRPGVAAGRRGRALSPQEGIEMVTQQGGGLLLPSRSSSLELRGLKGMRPEAEKVSVSPGREGGNWAEERM